jgi:hypothetical protein
VTTREASTLALLELRSAELLRYEHAAWLALQRVRFEPGPAEARGYLGLPAEPPFATPPAPLATRLRYGSAPSRPFGARRRP